MDDKITIIEGPPPTFEAVGDGWAVGLSEGPYLSNIAVTRLRTFNGPALIERCHRAWRNHNSIDLEYRDMDGLENRQPIVAARALDSDDGQMLVLWIRMQFDEDDIEEDELDDSDDNYYDDIDDNTAR